MPETEGTVCMRIAFFTETFVPHVDGVVTRLTHTVEELCRAGDDVLVVAPDAPGRPARYAGASVIGVPSVPLPLYPGFRLGAPLPTAPARRALHAFAPDIVHTINPVLVGLGAYAYAARHGTPLVASYHANIPAYARRYHLGVFEGLAWSYLRALHNRAHLNLCTSRPVQALLQARGVRHVALWEPGVDTALFHPQQRSESWRCRLTNGHPAATILLSVGRLAPEKGLAHLLAAVPHLPPGCHVAFVGDGPAAAALRHAARGLPVTFLGTLFDEDLAAAYAAADIFVLPSTTETLGLVAIEAMAAGTPVVGARRGGILDIVVDGETGLFFDPDTPGDLALRLTYLARRPAERRRMGVAARRRVADWNWTAVTAGLRRHYTRLLHGGSGHLPRPAHP